MVLWIVAGRAGLVLLGCLVLGLWLAYAVNRCIVGPDPPVAATLDAGRGGATTLTSVKRGDDRQPGSLTPIG